jgi:hypothetical protein
MGYHPGLEDDGVYLSAVKADLEPALYPHDSDFFRRQLQATVFDRAMAAVVHTTRMPVAWAELAGQFICLYGMLWAAHSIARRMFPERRAQWAGVALLAAMFTLPVAGSALNLADQHLHPRNVATALVLLAVDRLLSDQASARRILSAVPLLVAAFVVHPIMAALGGSFCVFLTLFTMSSARHEETVSGKSVAAAAPLSWIFEAPTPTWRRALETRRYYFLYRWTWYEWLGVIGPLVLFWLLRGYALRRNQARLARFALAVLGYGVFQQAVAMTMLGPASLIRLTPLQPMRYLHLVYIFMVLIGGCLLGRHLLQRSAWRWAVFLLAVNAGMFTSQRIMFAGTRHLELPWLPPQNPWLQAFAWVRQNTPRDAYFALDPNYLAAPGEDYHSFRALAERSQLADAIKDTAVVTQVPDLGPGWASQVDALAGWQRFGPADFARLREKFGVNWALVSYPETRGLKCAWHNDVLAVCPIPASPQVLQLSVYRK